MTDEMRLVLNTIRKCNRSGNEICISYAEIGKLTGLQPTMVSSCIRFLVSDGYLERIKHFNARGGAKANGYKIRKLEGV